MLIRRCAVVCMVMVASPLVARGPVPSCDIGGGDVVSIKQITPQFELALDDGRVLKLPGLNPLFVRENATVAAITAELQARAKTDVVLACEISPPAGPLGPHSGASGVCQPKRRTRGAGADHTGAGRRHGEAGR